MFSNAIPLRCDESNQLGLKEALTGEKSNSNR